MKRDYIGFGYNYKESSHHFYVIIHKDKEADIEIYERFNWDKEGDQVISEYDILKLKLTRQKWDALAVVVSNEFNNHLKQEKIPKGKFLVGGTPIERLLGKELMILLWGIENADPASIPTAIRNWLGLQPEERWWLYTMTNASSGGINDRKGWRTALKYALCENPV